MGRLDLLEPEVLAMILEYVNDASPHTSLAVSLTCKYLASVMKLIAYRHRVLRIRGSDKSGMHTLPDVIEKWSKDDAFLVNVRTLTVEGHLPALPKLEEILEDKELWEPLVRLISSIAKLRILTWNLAAIPIPVLDAFHTYQKFAKLRLFKYQPSIDIQPSERDKALARSPALTHLRSKLVPLATFPNPNMQETAFRRIVALAPLEYAGIVNHIGDTVAGEPQRKLPFRTSRKPNASIRFLTLDGYNMSKETLKDWSTIVDLTMLESVKCSRGFPELSYFENATAMLPNLKHVSLNFRQIVETGVRDTTLIESIQHYLNSCSPLESLSLWSWIRVVDLKGILEQHGPTLRSLQLHERESVHEYSPPRAVLSVDQLKDILRSCPNLKELTFDLNRQATSLDLNQNDSNLEYFTVLEGSKLNYLQIYLDEGLFYIYNHFGDTGNPPSAEDHSDNEAGESEEQDETDGVSDGQINHQNTHQAALSGSSEQSDIGAGLQSEGNVGNNVNSRRPTKRIKRSITYLKPSTEENMQSYVESIWKKVFARSMTARKLDIKFGEWETINARRAAGFTYMAGEERDHARFFMARPAERDDEKDKCMIVMKKVV